MGSEVIVEMLDLDVTGVAHGGWCVARDGGGRVVFVRHALPGERVRARVTEATASFARAEAVEVLRPSPDRVAPRCPHARPGGCGGCDWQHADLAAQRRLKAEVVREQLRRLAGLDREVTVEPVAGDADGLGWRTRVRFSVGPGGTAGLLAHRSHDVVEVGDCPIAHPLVQARQVTGRNWAPARSVEVVVSPAGRERALIVAPAPPGAGAPVAFDAMPADFCGIKPLTGHRFDRVTKERAHHCDFASYHHCLSMRAVIRERPSLLDARRLSWMTRGSQRRLAALRDSVRRRASRARPPQQ